MQANVLEGYFENGNFYDTARRVVKIPEKFKVYITLLDEKIDSNIGTKPLEKRPFSEMFGEWSGKVLLSSDFDEPLEELEEYM